jgi:hypothetical protein
MRTLSMIAAGAAIALMSAASAVRAGSEYQIDSNSGEKAVTYVVQFGGGKLFDRYTAFDPKSKKFVYLDWKRDAAAPRPAATIWDHRTGEFVGLYRFPGVEQPLPVIPTIEDMKVCPLTGDKHFQAKRIRFYD